MGRRLRIGTSGGLPFRESVKPTEKPSCLRVSWKTPLFPFIRLRLEYRGVRTMTGHPHISETAG